MHWALGRMCLTYSNIGRYAIIWTASIPSALCLSLSSNIFLRIFFRMVQTANDRWQRRLSSFTRPTWPWCFSFRCNICFYHCHFTWAYGNNCPCNVQATLNMIVRLSTCASERRKKNSTKPCIFGSLGRIALFCVSQYFGANNERHTKKENQIRRRRKIKNKNLNK